MSVDLATLGIKVDATEANQAGIALEKLAVSGDKAERSTKSLGTAASALNGSLGNTKSATSAAEAGMRGAAGATSDMADRVARLKASVDPLGAALDRVNAELGEAETLYARGAISASQYADAQSVLLARADILRGKQEQANAMLRGGASAARLTSNEMLNMSRQMSDVGVSLAMGMNPLMVLIQQGPQVADVLQMAGQRGVTAGAAFRQMGASAMPFLRVLGPIGLGVAAIGGAFAVLANEAEEGLGNVQAEFGFTEKQMKRLADAGVDTGYTMGDAFLGFYDTVKDLIVEAFGPQIDAVKSYFEDLYNRAVDGAVFAIKDIVGSFVGAYRAIQATWSMLPGAIGDLALSAANNVINAVEDMVNGAINRINKLAQMANTILPEFAQIGQLTNIDLPGVANRFQGQASATAAAGRQAYGGGYAEGVGMVDNFGNRLADNMRDRRSARLRDAAGEDDSRGAGRDRPTRTPRGANDNAAEDARNFIDQIKQETAELGKNRIELKLMAAERAAAKAPTQALREEILASAAAWRDATIANANAEFRRGLADEVEQLRFENSLLGMNAAAREEALAVREIELRIREQERQGLTVNRDAIAAETAAIIANARARGERQDAISSARDATTAIHDMTDALREGVDGFGELFGTAGAGFEAMINTLADYADRRADIQQRIAEADLATAEGQRERQRAVEELARAEVAHYGEVLGAAKTFFAEGSTGYRVLEAAERAYRIFQFAMQIRAMFMDKAETASSVANSGARAAADGVAAIAKAIASLPFPLNIAAGAATAAALVAFGVKVLGGKGGGKSATASASSAAETYSGPRDAYGNPTSSYSVLKPGSTVANDNALQPGGMAPANVGNFTSSPTYHINIEGNADDRTVAQIREALTQTEERAVERARAAAAQDRAAASTRQRIGGA